MPWLALPFGDVRKIHLERVFAVDMNPTIVAIGSSYGQTNKVLVDREIYSLILHGAEAYPFTEERFEYLEERAQEMAKRWPKKLKHDEHELVLSDYRNFYACNACMEMGGSWCFLCEKKKCNFFLHPKCALDKE
ncbi:hypothetical protein TIFTF001_049772 [Ficus carica]|uniref:DC1 domain-containing protein n=1 Tax=Ficus carica TaxID=3494 RepID=A0AA88DB00_FICCA|nr:hypothetical protein TIFTF001_049765 [Ficus carica]GMN32352.1 hypothetical protein TIFTF001_049767 [Ficus carica]GMN32379.1 hypothetical protein TIFTF001_049770 [Ficus carica]GMN32393.1 hypothetical protein TIFTF001_049772 [Ficus carica]